MKNIKSKILLTAIALLVAVSTLVASHTPIYWEYFGISVIVLAILITLQKREIKKELSENVNSEFNFVKFKIMVENVTIKLQTISEESINDNYQNNLMETLDESMPNIDDYRLTITNQLGIENYTKISIPFSQAERIINRGHSAAIDGYLFESQINIRKALKYLDLLNNEMNLIMSNENGK